MPVRGLEPRHAISTGGQAAGLNCCETLGFGRRRSWQRSALAEPVAHFDDLARQCHSVVLTRSSSLGLGVFSANGTGGQAANAARRRDDVSPDLQT